MNCKPGDLAVVVRAEIPQDMVLVGRVTRVTSSYQYQGEWVWKYKGRRLYDSDGSEILGLADRHLRPLRDSDDPDETLTWAGKPADVVAHGAMVPAGAIKALPHAVGGEHPSSEGVANG